MIELDKLLELADAASPGGYRHYKHKAGLQDRPPGWTVCRRGFEGKVVCRTSEADRYAKANAEYFSALSPPAVRTLIAQAKLGQLLLRHVGGLCYPQDSAQLTETINALAKEVEALLKGSAEC